MGTTPPQGLPSPIPRNDRRDPAEGSGSVDPGAACLVGGPCRALRERPRDGRLLSRSASGRRPGWGVGASCLLRGARLERVRRNRRRKRGRGPFAEPASSNWRRSALCRPLVRGRRGDRASSRRRPPVCGPLPHRCIRVCRSLARALRHGHTCARSAGDRSGRIRPAAASLATAPTTPAASSARELRAPAIRSSSSNRGCLTARVTAR